MFIIKKDPKEGKQEDWYREISKFIQNVEYVETYTDSSGGDEFGDIISKLYNDIKTTVTVKSVNTPSNVKVKIAANCE